MATSPNVTSALDTIARFKQDVDEAKSDTDILHRRSLMFRFDNKNEFNQFSAELSMKFRMKIENVQIFGNMYLVTVEYHPRSFITIPTSKPANYAPDLEETHEETKKREHWTELG